MRAFCTVSAPLEVCASSAEQLSPGSRFLALKLLGNQQPKTLYFLVDAKSRVREVYTQTCLHFATQGMLDTELFGLAVLIDGEYLFADLESKLSKYGPKSWRSSHTHGLDANGRPLLELHFRVQFYIESPFILKDETSRHNYYLQLKYNALQRDIPKEYSEHSMILLGSLALQADLGDAPAVETSTIPTTNSTKATKVEEDGANSNDCSSKDDVTSLSATCAAKVCTTSSGLTTVAAATSTTTLPKISIKAINTNENMPRLSTYNTSTAPTPSSSLVKSASGSSSSVFPIGGSLKRSLGAMAATFSPSPPSLSINHGIGSITTPATNTFSPINSMPLSTQTDYFRLEEYLPTGLRTAWAVSALRAHHREKHGMSTADAELYYIHQSSIVHESINAHTFRMRLSKSENGPGRSWFIVYAKGIKIYSTNDSPQQLVTTFLWPNITKLSFERKKFEIRSGDSKITLYATSDDKNKMLLTLCKETHQFSMKIAARLKEVIKREEEESNCLHACYIYSRSLHLPYKNKNDQRISVISSTSSNTTSGIISDRVHSEDELEIMINTPPVSIAAPSTESLALAHLLDQPSVSRQTSSVGEVSLKDLEDQLVALSVRQAQKHLSCNSGGSESPLELSNASENSSASDSNPTCSQRTVDSSITTDSPSSQHNIGSQCSSTCSTVVIASALESTTNVLASLTGHTNTNSTPTQRRNSTSSSLELGFSHTAQNSTLSEGESFIPSTRGDIESISGVYTLAQGAPPTETSGVYTMHSSEMTGQSSEIAESDKSSHYGIFQPTKNEVSELHLRASHTNLDSIDGGNYHGKRIKNEEFRLRSDSNVSTSDSFRGDGSDPTDNKHTLLSAEELTDLIVGRGTYPNRKTVSNTLDSDCDYVTLPLPMEGESYIQGHQDTAPTEDHVEDLMNDLLATDPPAPPERMDSNNLNHKNLVTLSNIRMRSPPPYNAPHEKTGLCGPPIRSFPPVKPIVSTPSSSNVPSTAITIKTKTVPKATATTSTSSSAIRRRDPPPYPSSVRPRPTSLNNHSSNMSSTIEGSTTSLKSEEATARFITTRPQISILKAHTSIVNENHRPSYAAPTNYSSAASSTGSVSSHQISSHSVHNSNYAGGSQTSLSMNSHSVAKPTPLSMSASAVAVGVGVIPSTIGIPIVPYSLHGTHKSMVSDMKPQPPHTCVLLPVIKPRQFLPPPPPNLPRQPPPPPPPQLAGVYSSQLARKQLELYQQQLYSDVDYVIYPIQDPAVSQQEYLDSKQGSILAAMAQTSQTPHPYLAYHASSAHAGGWDTYKGHAIYRSTPYLPLSLSAHSRYASTQNLSDTYVQLPSAYSPLYSPSMASLCSSFEPPPPPPLHPALVNAAANAPNLFARSRSDDNILNSLDSLPKVKRLPPPPPPPYVNRRLKKLPMPAPTEKPPPIPSKPSSSLNNNVVVSSTTSQMPSRSHQFMPQTLNTTGHNINRMTKTSSGAQWAGERPRSDGIGLNHGSSSILAHLQASVAAANRGSTNITNITKNSTKTYTPLTCSGSSGSTGTIPTTANALDIALLREKSKHLDLPLISALCNDRSLLKQTKVLVNPKHSRAPSNKLNSNTVKLTATEPALSSPIPTSVAACHSSSKSLATISSITMAPNPNSSNVIIANTSSTTTLTAHLSAGKTRKSSISHRHPNDKLPPLPMQLAEANNYVMDPAILRHHKNCNSQI